MKIKMLTTAPGSVDGIRVTEYEAGTEYDLSATAGERDLAEAFVGAGMANVCVEKSAAVPDAAPAEIEGEDAAPVRAKPGRKPK